MITLWQESIGFPIIFRFCYCCCCCYNKTRLYHCLRLLVLLLACICSNSKLNTPTYSTTTSFATACSTTSERLSRQRNSQQQSEESIFEGDVAGIPCYRKKEAGQEGVTHDVTSDQSLLIQTLRKQQYDILLEIKKGESDSIHGTRSAQEMAHDPTGIIDEKESIGRGISTVVDSTIRTELEDWEIAKNATLNAPFGLGIGPVILQNFTFPPTSEELTNTTIQTNATEIPMETLPSGATRPPGISLSPGTVEQTVSPGIIGEHISLGTTGKVASPTTIQKTVPPGSSQASGATSNEKIRPSSVPKLFSSLAPSPSVSPRASGPSIAPIEPTLDNDDQFGPDVSPPTTDEKSLYRDVPTKYDDPFFDEFSSGQDHNNDQTYEAPPDTLDPLSISQSNKTENVIKNHTDWTDKTPKEIASIAEQEADNLVHDKYVQIVVGASIIIAIGFMLFVAQQMVEHPHGACAKLCRCTIGCLRCIIYPFRVILCCYGCGSERSRDRRTHRVLDSDEPNELELT